MSRKIHVTLEINADTGKLEKVFGEAVGKDAGEEWLMKDILISVPGASGQQSASSICPPGTCPIIINNKLFCMPCGG